MMVWLTSLTVDHLAVNFVVTDLNLKPDRIYDVLI